MIRVVFQNPLLEIYLNEFFKAEYNEEGPEVREKVRTLSKNMYLQHALSQGGKKRLFNLVSQMESLERLTNKQHLVHTGEL